MKEFFEAIAKWFWDAGNLPYSISHIVLVVVIFALIIALVVFICLRKRAHRLTKMYADREHMKDEECASLRKTIENKDIEIAKLHKAVDDSAKEKENVAVLTKLNKEFAKIFKESLIVSKKTATIAVDTTNILDALSVDDIKAYGEQIGAKIKSGMNKAEMIKVIRKTENIRKNLEK